MFGRISAYCLLELLPTFQHKGDLSMLRRNFLKQTGAAALTTTLSAPFVHASDKTDSKNPIVGEGEHRYECLHDWGEVPSSIHWFETHGVAIDKAGFIYIKHRAGGQKPKSPDEAQDTIVVFDPAGKFVRSFGKEYHGGGHGIDIREENGQEFLYLCCMFPVNLVVKTDLKGEVVWIKEAPTEPHVYDKPGRRSRQPTWPSPPTAASMSATATARTTSTSSTRTPSGYGPSAARATNQASSRHRTVSGWITALAASRCLSLPTAPTPGSST